jgi:hypothetical protein
MGGASWALQNSMLGAFPYEAIPRLTHGAGKNSSATWENSALEVNRNMASEWDYATPLDYSGEPLLLGRYGSPCETGDVLELPRVRGFMRVSAKDPRGFVTNESYFAGLRAAPYAGIA